MFEARGPAAGPRSRVYEGGIYRERDRLSLPPPSLGLRICLWVVWSWRPGAGRLQGECRFLLSIFYSAPGRASLLFTAEDVMGPEVIDLTARRCAITHRRQRSHASAADLRPIVKTAMLRQQPSVSSPKYKSRILRKRRLAPPRANCSVTRSAELVAPAGNIWECSFPSAVQVARK